MSHAKSTLTGLEAGAMPGMGSGVYKRLFDPKIVPAATRLDVACLRDIAEAMIKADDGEAIDTPEVTDENPTIPAAYTYFGQFVDHDITLDPTPLSVDTGSLVDALEDFRTPALDLDCIYGRGKDDQPYMYDDKCRLLLKDVEVGNGNANIGTKHDLLRINERAAVIGDKRNDENKIVSQIQSAMISFHNKVVRDDALLRRVGAQIDVTGTWSQTQADDSRFRAAVNLVRWHYQWVVVNDYLNRICDSRIVTEVLNPGNVPRLMHYAAQVSEYPYMPVEFSAAAFRFGHSMVRPSYALNIDVGTNIGRHDVNDKSEPVKPRVPTFRSGDPDPRKSLNGFPGTLAGGWGIDWGYFLPGIKANTPADAVKPFQVPQPSYRIDANLVAPLSNLPEFNGEPSSILKNLAYRNLVRGQQLALPSGESVANALHIKPLQPDVLWSAGSCKAAAGIDNQNIAQALKDGSTVRQKVADTWLKNGLCGNTPLWYYILREAEWCGVTNQTDEPGVALGGQHLGPVGSRIVVETIVGLLWFDDTSYLHANPPFSPTPEILGTDLEFTLTSLIRYALTY